jgi:hypothetical protein
MLSSMRKAKQKTQRSILRILRVWVRRRGMNSTIYFFKTRSATIGMWSEAAECTTNACFDSIAPFKSRKSTRRPDHVEHEGGSIAKQSENPFASRKSMVLQSAATPLSLSCSHNLFPVRRAIVAPSQRVQITGNHNIFKRSNFGNHLLCLLQSSSSSFIINIQMQPKNVQL